MAKETVFDKASFNEKVRSEVAALESDVEKYLASIMGNEAKSKVDNSFKDTLAQFKSSVTARDISGKTKTFPDEVYKVILAKSVIPTAPKIDNIDRLEKEMAAYIAVILGTNNTVTTKDGKRYVVDTTLAGAGLATVTDEGRLYTLDWKNDAAKNSLYGLLGNLTTWGQNLSTYLFNELKNDVRDALIGKWFNALLTGSGAVAKDVYETLDDFLDAGGDATDIPSFAEDNYSEWFKWLSDLTKKYFSATNKKVNTLRSQCQKLDKLAADTKLLKDYKSGKSAEELSGYVTGLTSYKNFITAYNKLQAAIEQPTSNFDSLIPDYIGYKITGVVSDTFSEDKATISCAGDNNNIEITGSKVSINTWRGNDTIISGTYDEASGSNTINAGAGDDFISNYSSNTTIDAGTGNDSIRSQAAKVSIDGGDGSDNIETWNSSVTVQGGAGVDSIYSHGSDGSIFGGAGDDEILVMGGYVDGGTGVDTIAIQGSNVTAYGGGSFDMLPTKDVFNISSGASNVYIKDFEFGDVLNLPAGSYTARIEFGSTAIRNSSGKLIVWLSGFTDRLENFTYVEDDKQATDGDDSINNDVSNIKIDLGAGDDNINNSGDNVTIDGGAGNDLINSSGNNVTITGGADDDFVSASGNYYSNSLIDASEGNNTVYVYSYYYSSTTVKTDSGDDFVSIYGGGSIDAGDGNNTIYGSGTIKTGSGDDYISINSGLIDAGEGNNTVYSAYEATVKTGAGDDFVSIKDGVFGRGSIDAGDGNNTIYGYGYGTVKTGSGNDYIDGSGSIDAGEGNNTVYADHNATVKTGSDDDVISIKGGSEFSIDVDAGDGKNIVSIYGGSSSRINATLKTGADDDVISIDGGGYKAYYKPSIDANIDAGEGNNTVRVNRNYSSVNVTIKIGSGDDYVSIYEASTSVDAGDGNNTIYASFSDVTIKTGSGDDYVSIDDGSIDAGDGNNTVRGSKATVKTGSGNDYVSITDNSSLDAGGGNDSIINSGWFDSMTIDGGAGDDQISLGSYTYNLIQYTAGEGNDTIWGFYSSSTLSISGGEYTRSTVGNDVIITVGDGSILLKDAKGKTLNIDGEEGDPTRLTLTNNSNANVKLDAEVLTADATARTKNLILVGNELDNTLLGGANKNTLRGGEGNDSIVGGKNADKLYGEAGSDTLLGGTGNDTLTGGAGDDVFVYAAGDDLIADYATGDKISLGSAITKATVSGSNVLLTTDNGSLTIKNAKAKTLSLIDATGSVQETIIGSTTLLVTDDTPSPVTLDSSTKTVDASSRTKPIKITGNSLANSIVGGSGKDTLGGGAGNDSITGGAGNDSINGGSGNDCLVGGAGNDKLYGYAGNDTLVGGTGNDSLWGQAGADTFLYSDGDGKDIICGFDDDDLLQIAGTFTPLITSAGDISFKVGSTYNAVVLKNFTATTFNVNDATYQIVGKKLLRK